MPAQNQAMVLWRGDDVRVDIPVRGPDGSALDLTGASARWRMADGLYDGAVVRLDRSTAVGDMTLTPVGGVWTISVPLSKQATAAIPPGSYVHEAEITDANGETQTVTTGAVTMRAALMPA